MAIVLVGVPDGARRYRPVPERLARFVGRGPVNLKPPDPCASLIIAAALEAADEAAQIERAGDGNATGDHGAWARTDSKRKGTCAGRETVAASRACPRAGAEIAPAPVRVDRGGRRRWRNPHVGGECRRRPQARRDQHPAPEKQLSHLHPPILGASYRPMPALAVTFRSRRKGKWLRV